MRNYMLLPVLAFAATPALAQDRDAPPPGLAPQMDARAAANALSPVTANAAPASTASPAAATPIGYVRLGLTFDRVAPLLAETIMNVFADDSVSAIFGGENQLF